MRRLSAVPCANCAEAVSAAPAPLADRTSGMGGGSWADNAKEVCDVVAASAPGASLSQWAADAWLAVSGGLPWTSR